MQNTNSFYSADYIFPVVGNPLLEGVVEVDPTGTIIRLYSDRTLLPGHANVTIHKGIIVPGFINAHCHLELSHMKGRLPTGLGLTSFIEQVMRQRQASSEELDEAMASADQEMYLRGIVAVGDHVNTLNSLDIKKSSRLRYHTFIELLGFDPSRAQEIYNRSLALKAQWVGSCSITPHAPYSVSKDLLKLLKKDAELTVNPLSIHNQETEEENKFFRYKEGKFLDFFKNIQQNIDSFKAQAKSSLQTYLTFLNQNQPLMLVHNTFTSAKDLSFSERLNRKITWCFCPKANLYIEGTLPKIDHFRSSTGKIALGTDSLASNDTLCILTELKTLHAHYPELQLVETISWATLHGAQHLQFDKELGSIEVGKKPGLNLLEHVDGMNITANSSVRKLC